MVWLWLTQERGCLHCDKGCTHIKTQFFAEPLCPCKVQAILTCSIFPHIASIFSHRISQNFCFLPVQVILHNLFPDIWKIWFLHLSWYFILLTLKAYLKPLCPSLHLRVTSFIQCWSLICTKLVVSLSVCKLTALTDKIYLILHNSIHSPAHVLLNFASFCT